MTLIRKMKLAVLDLVFLRKGHTAADAIRASVDLASHVEALGYERFWVAEHHASLGIASSSPEILISHIAQSTKKIRVGSGGIMLPNHSTLHIAEVFRTLETVFPNRIDLGLGRAPGTDRKTSDALRQGPSSTADDFPLQVANLIRYLQDDMPVRAVPMGSQMPEIWLLGSSDFGARLAAQMGLPYSFAQHFSALDAISVMKAYQALFQPSVILKKPKVSMGCHIICADTDREAQDLALSSDLSMSVFVRTGQSEPMRSFEEAKTSGMTDEDRAAIRAHFPKFVGSPETVKSQLAPYLEVADELVITTAVYDQEARLRSYELVAKVLKN
jgi:luciferase family oxidoreductase group 1